MELGKKPDGQFFVVPPTDQQEKVCLNCGTTMPIESNFCHKCSTKMLD
jgi:ribosomal protein L40E